MKRRTREGLLEVHLDLQSTPIPIYFLYWSSQIRRKCSELVRFGEGLHSSLSDFWVPFFPLYRLVACKQTGTSSSNTNTDRHRGRKWTTITSKSSMKERRRLLRYQDPPPLLKSQVKLHLHLIFLLTMELFNMRSSTRKAYWIHRVQWDSLLFHPMQNLH